MLLAFKCVKHFRDEIVYVEKLKTDTSVADRDRQVTGNVIAECRDG